MLQAPAIWTLYLLTDFWQDFSASASALFCDGAFSQAPQMKYSTVRSMTVVA